MESLTLFCELIAAYKQKHSSKPRDSRLLVRVFHSIDQDEPSGARSVDPL